MKPQLIVEQKITAFANKYSVYKAHEDGSKGQLIAFAQQKRLAFKEKVQFYTDESKNEVAFSFRAEKVMDIHGKFLVEDPSGQLIGGFQKDFKKSLINSTWHILNSEGTTALTVNESNQAIAVLRRYVGFVPLIGDVLDLILAFIKYHFSFRTPAGEEVGQYKKTTLFVDHYTLSMSDETFATYDWRTLAAMAVALDALQGR